MTAAIERPRLPIWVVVIAGGAITALSLGVRSTFGLLVTPIADGLSTDLGTISFAIAIQNLLWGFSQPIAGALSDRFGAPRVLAAGGALYSIAMLLMSTATSSGMILLSGGFLTGIAVGAASFAVVLSAVGRMAPPERRSMMLGVVSAVGSLGQFVLIPVSRWLLDNGSWERTSLALAIIVLPVIALSPMMRSLRIAQSFEDDAPTTPLRHDLRRAASSGSYLMLNGAFFVCGFHVTFIGIHLAGYVDGSGISPTTASYALSLIGLFNVAGSLAVGYLGQTVSYTKLLAGIYGMRAVTIAAFVVLPLSGTSTIVFAIVMGVLWLSTVPPTSAIVAQQFGPANAGALFGIVFLSHQLGSFIGAWLGGVVVDITDSYLLMWWLAVALGVFAAVMHLLIDEGPVDEPPPDRRLPLIPSAAATVLVVLGISAALTLSTPEIARDDAAPMSYCVLGPTLIHG